MLTSPVFKNYLYLVIISGIMCLTLYLFATTRIDSVMIIVSSVSLYVVAIICRSNISLSAFIYIAILLHFNSWIDELKHQVFFKPNNRLEIDLSSYLSNLREKIKKQAEPLNHNTIDIYNQKLNHQFSDIKSFANLYNSKDRIQDFFVRLSLVKNLNKALKDKDQVKYLDYLFYHHYNCNRFIDSSLTTSTCEQYLSHFKEQDKNLIKEMFKEYAK